jgi:pyruvate dehydrogenase E2 component (dihydrolipoamide acetyltransferase)
MDLKLPALGEGADSGTVVNLFVKEGDAVTKDQPILELENEKAIATIPAPAAGTVSKVYVKTGDKISVGQRILTLADAGAKPEPGPKAKAAPARSPKPEPAPETELEAPAEAAMAAEHLGPAETAAPVAASPAVRKLARDLGIDLARIHGSERGGRIVLEDLRAYIQRLQRLASQRREGAAPAKAGEHAVAAPKPPPESIDFSKWGPVTKQALSPLRQVIARRMSENWNAVPHVTQFDEADITALNALRKKHAPAYEAKGARLTLTGFALKAVVEALKKHPVFNASLDEAGQQLVFKQYYHIGVAVDTEAGLIVPVLRDVDKKSVFALSQELEDLAQRARARKVSGDELKGGTFTISNQGGIGGAHFTPIVNKPEVAILGLGRGAMKAVVRDNKIEPRLMLPLGLSYDHRVIDGGTAARFIVDLVKALENLEEGLVAHFGSSSSSFSSS